jgi:hypothetical protein
MARGNVGKKTTLPTSDLIDLTQNFAPASRSFQID